MSDDTDDIGRRRMLEYAGSAIVSVGIAGCTGRTGGKNTGTETTTSGSTETQETTESSESTETEGASDVPDSFPVTITQGQMPTTLDPHNHRSTPTDIVMMQAYEGLLSRTRVGKITSMLADEWERKEPGRFRFHVREGPTFHETGSDLSPEDVAYSINRIVKPDVGFKSPQAGQLLGVTGAEVVDGERAVDVLSDGLNPLVVSEFATYADIVEKEWVKSHEDSYIAKHMNGTGPFELDQYDQNVRVTFTRYDDYWKAPASVSKLTFNAAKETSVRVNKLVEGETDLTVNVPPQEVSRVKQSGDARLDAVPSTRIIYNAMRYDVEPFSSPKFRRAMNYAVDLQGIVEDVLQGFGGKTGQPTLKGFFGFEKEVDPFPQDKKKAERLVEESGHAGASITLHTPVGRYLKDVQIAQAVAGMIDDLSNVSCEVKQREFGALAAELTDGKIETSPHFYLIGWGNATFNAVQTIRPLLTCAGSVSSYCNDEVEQKVEKSMNTGARKKRDTILQNANDFLHDQAPWIYLNRQYSVYGASARLDWKARRDERIDAYAIEPASAE